MSDLSQVTEYADHRDRERAPEPVRFLLDIDGVINAYAAPVGSDLVTRDVMLDGFVYRVRIRPQILSAIRSWHAHPMVDLRWCTTWQTDANRVLAPAFDLPELPVVSGGRADGAWKRGAAEQALSAGIPLIWCDDVHATWPLVSDLVEYRSPALLIAPDPATGLAPGHLERIGRFIAAYTGG